MHRLLGFLLTAVIGAVAFGIAHDLVTAHVSVEYFSVHHPRVIESDAPIPLALAWGFLATWWVGLAAGLVIATCNSVGRAEALPWANVRKAYVRCLLGLWLSSMAVLVSVYVLASLVPANDRRPDFEANRRLMAVAVTHLWSYAGAAALILAIAVWIVLSRLKPKP